MTDFVHRHIGSSDVHIQEMGLPSPNALAQAIMPEGIRIPHPLNLPMAQSEEVMLAELCPIGDIINYPGLSLASSITIASPLPSLP